MENILELAEKNQQKAREIINKVGIVESWQSIGAEINLVGSLANGLLMKHRDIDFHIYTPVMSIRDSFAAMTEIAAHPGVINITYNNLLATEDGCLEWHARYEDDEGELWQIDMMHILRGSKYDGYFEKVAAAVKEKISDEQRYTVLLLKYQTPDDIKIPGIEYYLAVMRDGITDWNNFIHWHKNVDAGIIEWIP